MSAARTTLSHSLFRFDGVAVCPLPYPHFEAADFLDAKTAAALLDWLGAEARWEVRNLNGYVGYADLALYPEHLPLRLKAVAAPASLALLRTGMGKLFPIEREGRVKVTAHRLLEGSTLKPHCDLSPLRFTHRLLVQLNRGWSRKNGGLLRVHDGDPEVEKGRRPKLVPPRHRSAFGFEISSRSFHSVSPVKAGERYTLSYTFYPPPTK